MAESTHIRIKGAKEHNLKNIDLDIPKNSLVVITGLSGSGKSSLAFDTIYAEGQRRYVESLSSYARQFLEMQGKPDVESIEGLSPAISIEQKTTSKNPRSTVGTVTEIHDYLRLLYARVGIPYSPITGLPIEAQQVSQMVDRIMEIPEKTRLLILAPIVRGRKGEYKKEIAELQKQGYMRIRINGEIYDIAEAPSLDKKFKHDIEVVVDRIVVKKDIQTRLADSLETALNLTDGIAWAMDNDTGERHIFSSKFADPESGFSLDEIEPRIFSFNSPFGACPDCDGLGQKVYFDVDLVIPDKTVAIKNAIAPWQGRSGKFYRRAVQNLCIRAGASHNDTWQEITPTQQKEIIADIGKYLEKRFQETESQLVRDNLAQYQRTAECPSCKGQRLKPESLCVKVAEKNIAEISELSIRRAVAWFENIEERLSKKQNEIAFRILREINERLGFLNSVGLGYLSLSRASGTLSGGESQRIRLASQIGSGLTGVLYVLDEPSIGLHQRDNDRLLQTLKRLRDLDNTVIVVEHDEDTMNMADYLIDMGPGAGIHGGEVIAQGKPDIVKKNKKSLTGQYLMGVEKIEVPKSRRKGNGKKIQIKGATGNNLKNINVDIPLGKLVCITGVSGSGKSTLINETLYKALAHTMNKAKDLPAPHKEIKGLEHIDKVVDIDQSPIGRTPRSNPATYTGLFSPIRDWFAALPESKARGYKPGRFSFNVKGGRCEACQGGGMQKIEMHFLPDIYVECDICHGKRYNRETLEVEFKGKSISDILDLSVEEGLEFFAATPSIRDRLATLDKVGLSYIHLGQPATTLSGGEAQRIKLSRELAKRATGKTFYLLDEPTTGLHFHDVKKLLEVLHTLVEQGNTVVVIEHNLDVVKTADWIIDLGPEGGSGGGEIIAKGTPEQIIKIKESHTGQYLKKLLNPKKS
ncbi:MAG: excinuclease ABC subunit UvrA [Alphaproteobacteria bacterium]